MILFINYLYSILKFVFFGSGTFFLCLAIFAFTTAPFWGIHWLGTSKAQLIQADKIVLLGGGGMPSESNLMRLWYAIEVAESQPNAEFIIAIPGDTSDVQSAICKMALYAEQRGVRSEQIKFECLGANTRSQALNIFKRYYSSSDSILLVTSPEHLRRAILAFKKVGFDKLGGIPAFPTALEGKLCYSKCEIGDTKFAVPDVGENLQVRYQFWNHLIYEIVLLREYCALTYYWINDWI